MASDPAPRERPLHRAVSASRLSQKELDNGANFAIPVLAMMVGDLLDGRFEITHEIARGGMGAVFLAHDIRLDRPVALKVILPDLLANASTDFRRQLRMRIAEEAQLAAKVDHPHAVTIHDLGAFENGLPFYVMEIVAGEALRDHIDREGPLTLGSAAEILRQVASVIEAAEAVGVVHRDIKSENVMLEMRDGRPFAKVIDFGIAKRTLGGLSLTGTGLPIGTPETMAPEQFEQQPDIDSRADIYALAGLLYEMLAGRRAFTGHGYIRARLNVDFEPLSVLRPEIPTRVDAFIRKNLAWNRDDRCPDMTAFLEDLERAVTGLDEYEARSPVAIAAVPVPATSPRGRTESAAESPGSGTLAELLTRIFGNRPPFSDDRGTGENASLTEGVSILLDRIEIVVLVGDIVDVGGASDRTAVVLPANTSFVDDCITDPRSAMGAFSLRHYPERLDELRQTIASQLPSSTGTSWPVGTTIVLPRDFDVGVRVLMTASAQRGTEKGILAEPATALACVREIFSQTAGERLERLRLPALGSGHGGLDIHSSVLLLVLGIQYYGRGYHHIKRVEIVIRAQDALKPSDTHRLVDFVAGLKEKKANLTAGVSISIGQIEVVILAGNIVDVGVPSDHAAVVLPANTSFVDDCITDAHGALGAFVLRHYPTRIEKLRRAITDQLPRSTNNHWSPGTTVILPREFDVGVRVLLAASAQRVSGKGILTEPTTLFACVREVFLQTADQRVERLRLPVLGSGHGGLDIQSAILLLLLGIQYYGRTYHHIKRVEIVVRDQDVSKLGASDRVPNVVRGQERSQ